MNSMIILKHLFIFLLIVITKDSIGVVLARVGWSDQQIFAGKLSTLQDTDLGPPIHSLVIPGDMHFLEVDMLKMFAIMKSEFEHFQSG